MRKREDMPSYILNMKTDEVKELKNGEKLPLFGNWNYISAGDYDSRLIAALRTRLEEAEKVAGQAIKAIYEGNGDLLEGEIIAVKMYDSYRLKYPALPHTEGEQKG